MKNPQTIPPFDFDVSRWGALPRLRGLFVTGTDTGVGKTLIAGAIARSLRRSGAAVEVFKPAATGCRRAGGLLISQDAEFLAACADSSRMLSEICPVRYAAAVAPNVAAELERRPVDLQLIFDEYRRIGAGGKGDCTRFRSFENDGCPHLADSGDRRHFQKTENGASPPHVVVEGVGGLLCPIADDFWVIHLAKMMNLPLVIVARAGLGTINHACLTLHAARSAGLAVAGVVINRYLIEPPSDGGKRNSVKSAKRSAKRDCTHFPSSENGDCPSASGDSPLRGDVDMAMFTNPRQIEARGRVKVLALVPEEKESSVEEARIGPDVQFAIDQVDWPSLAASARRK